MARIPAAKISRFKKSLLSPTTLNPSKPSPSLSSSSVGSYPNDLSIALLKSCHSMRKFFQIHAHLIATGMFLNPSVAARVLKHSADYGDLGYTVLIFRSIDTPNPFCVNTLIKAYSTSCDPSRAVVVYFDILRDGFFLPNSFTYPPLLSSCARARRVGDGRKCHGQALKRGFDHVVPVDNSLTHMYGSCGELGSALQVFDEMPERDLVSWNSIVNSYTAAGELDIARRLFDEMPKRNVVSWNIMIDGYLEGGNPGSALKLFRQMARRRARGSDTTIVSVLTACGRSARLKEGRSVHGSLVRTFAKSSLVMDTALIDMYSKCQRVEVAQRVFDRVTNRNLYCWNAMVLGHCIHGKPEEGLNLFAEMVNGIRLKDAETKTTKRTKQGKGHGILPDAVTFIGVLCSCARAGLLIEGRSYFSQMQNLFGIKPNFAHYWCMANLFAGVGLIQEAVETLKSMPQEEDDALSQSTVWAGLLGLCRFQGNVTLGERVAKSLIQLEPQNLSCYALLLNIYAVAGQWEDVARVKELIKAKGFKKIPGCRLLDLKETVHKFKVGGQGLFKMEEISMMDHRDGYHGSSPPPVKDPIARSQDPGVGVSSREHIKIDE